jgi:anti-sigma factor RsiW
MHAVVMQNLEGYLAGALEPVTQREIERHLSACEKCRTEVRSMQEVSQWFGSLRSEEPVVPAPGFYARVMERAAPQAAQPSFAALFGINLAFGRRLVLASLLTLAVVGTYLVSREEAYPGGLSPEAVMAQQESPAFDSASAQDNMLVSLTAYEH